jgi:hypothetical protein
VRPARAAPRLEAYAGASPRVPHCRPGEYLKPLAIGPRPTRGYFGPATILNLYRIAHSESTVDKWDNSPSPNCERAVMAAPIVVGVK